MRDLLDTAQDPAKSRWFDYAASAFNSKYADPNGPNGVDAEALAFFPSYLMDLDGAVRDQDLKPTQIRDLTNKMLDDTERLYLAGRQAPSDTNTSRNMNADKNVIESTDKPNQTDGGQGQTDGAARGHENTGYPENPTSDLIFSSADIARPDMGMPGGGGGPPSGGMAPGPSTTAKIGAWAGLAALLAGLIRLLVKNAHPPEPDELKGPDPYEQEPKPAAMPPKSYPPPVFGPPPPTGR
jgi:hypothetical protein